MSLEEKIIKEVTETIKANLPDLENDDFADRHIEVCFKMNGIEITAGANVTVSAKRSWYRSSSRMQPEEITYHYYIEYHSIYAYESNSGSELIDTIINKTVEFSN